jgi:hypothetical protein
MCSLCGRFQPTSRHHLAPRARGGKNGPITPLCGACHRQLHALYSNRELAERLASLDALRADARVAAYLRWVEKAGRTRPARTRRDR